MPGQPTRPLRRAPAGATGDDPPERLLAQVGPTIDRRLARLLDPTTSPIEQHQIVHQWHDDWLALLGLAGAGARGQTALTGDIHLPGGRAIAPILAARCLCDLRRTVVFLQALDAAIQRAVAQAPGRPVRVVEAGSGPLAALSLPFARRYGPGQVRFTAIDIHPFAVEQVRRLAAILDVEASVTAAQADLATVRFAPDERPDIIVCEVMRQALAGEPQVAATRNLAPQLAPGGAFLPARVEVRAALYDAGARIAAMMADPHRPGPSTAGLRELGPVLCLDAAALPPPGEDLAPARIAVPPATGGEALHLLTRLQVDADHGLEDFESSITLPDPVAAPAGLTREGGEVEFRFDPGPPPGLRMRVVSDRSCGC